MIKKYKSYFLYFLILVYISGSIGFVVNPPFFSPFTPYTLLLTCFVFLIHSPVADKKFIIAFFSVAFLAYFIEVIGVKTGLIFGRYSYGNGLGLKLIDVPLIISINWAILICAGIRIVSSIFVNKITVLVVAALLVTGIDLLIEQVAPKLDFWQFEGGLPSLHNYLGWIGVAFFTSYFFYPTIIKGNRSVSLIILILQIIFFTSLFIFI
ncbi:carotenoid biosynthesis protein [Flavobacterium sp.]|jgi:putative membrane protein|uniref:carotenoid biosynthesis protein n=1 Tax=Flavobacterium sp. TaxID=239 RepID=UPI0037BF07B8